MEVDQPSDTNFATFETVDTEIPPQYIYSDKRSQLYVAFHTSSTLHFIGCIRIRVLYGCLKVHGAILIPDGQCHRIYSTSAHPTYITHSTTQFSTYPYKDISSLEEFLFAARTNSKYGVSVKDSEKILFKLSETDEYNYVSICLIRPTSIPIAFLARKKFKNLFQLPNTNPILPFFHPLKTAKSLLTPQITTHWETILDGISNLFSPKVLICGPKGAGKSSFCTYLSNYLLNTHEVVFFIECDPGQPEFLPTGTLGVQALTKPKLGPAYTHKVTSEINYFYGSNSPASDPKLYVEIIERMLESIQLVYNGEFDIPVIINTCGWVEGLGISLLADIIYLTRPSVIIAKYIKYKWDWLSNLGTDKINLNRVFSRANDSPSYNVELVNCDSSTQETIPGQNTCRLYSIESFLSSLSQARTPSLLPGELRTLSLVTYFAKVLRFNSHFNYLDDILFKCPLYEIPIHKFLYKKVSVDFPNSGLLDVLNANIIGLGVANSESSIEEVMILDENIKFLNSQDICSCFGLGFVRFINEREKKLAVTTPVKIDKLEKVNLIMIGSKTLLQSFYAMRKLDENSFFSMERAKSKSKATKCRRANKQLKNTRKYFNRLNYSTTF